jgi:tartrate/fumarate subfamily iron-sulfur-dependent hydro-lyase beta chain
MAILKAKPIEYPYTIEKIRDLKPGQLVSLSGHLFACRDRVHRHLAEGGASPVPLKDGGIFHCGPAVLRKEGGWIVRAAGPTTSMRHEPYMARIIEQHQVRVIVGKGGMGAQTIKACSAAGCVYLQTVGGAAQLLAARIEQVAGVYFLEEFGPTEALWNLVVKDFPAIVAIDAHGRSLYRHVENASKKAMKRVLKTVAFKV